MCLRGYICDTLRFDLLQFDLLKFDALKFDALNFGTPVVNGLTKNKLGIKFIRNTSVIAIKSDCHKNQTISKKIQAKIATTTNKRMQ